MSSGPAAAVGNSSNGHQSGKGSPAPEEIQLDSEPGPSKGALALSAKVAGAVGLCLTAGPAVLVAGARLDLDTHKSLMLVGTVIWFVSALVLQRGAPKS